MWGGGGGGGGMFDVSNKIKSEICGILMRLLPGMLFAQQGFNISDLVGMMQVRVHQDLPCTRTNSHPLLLVMFTSIWNVSLVLFKFFLF